MRLGWLTIFMLITTLTLVGCKSETSQPVAPDPKAAEAKQETSDKVGGPTVNRPEDDIARWTAIVASQSTANNWNELSYANLQAGRWDAAVEAGEKALKLQHDHPYALYNTGTALLELGRAQEALFYLRKTSGLQPTRPEPHTGLARAYQSLGHYLLASYHARTALTLSKGEPETATLERSIQTMLDGAPPADYADTCAQKLTNGQFFLCLFQEPGPEQVATASSYPTHRYTLYAAAAGRPVQRIPLGYTSAGEFVLTTLPESQSGYWLKGGPVGAGVARTLEWRLFAWDGDELRQILFTGGDFFEGEVSDFMRSPYEPQIIEELISTTHRDDFSGSRTMRTTRRLSLSEGTAAVVATEEIITGPLSQISPEIEVTASPSYKWAYPLAAGAEIYVDGKPSARENLAIGMRTTITVENGQITKVDARSK